MSDGTIVVAGEALVDLVPTTAGDLRAHPGGGPFNTARALARLEQPVSFLGCISDDRFGRRLRAELEADGVRLDAVVSTGAPTTLALAQIDDAGVAGYEFYTEGTSAPALTPQDALAALPPRVDMLHVGTLGLVLEPLVTAVEAVVEAVSERALVMVDPNCRPSVIHDRGAYRSRLARLLGRTDLVKASIEDLAWLEPGEAPGEAARRLLAHGPAVALVTCGAEGGLVVTPDAVRVVPAPAVDVIDTIGAGDAFGGAFLAWWRMQGLLVDDLHRLDTVAAAVEFACAVAARTCERAGAAPPRLGELPQSI